MKKTEGGDGWADVWMRGHFGWEYKGKHKDLKDGLPPTAALPRGPGKPAATGRLRHGPLRGPHEFHQHGQGNHEFDLAGLADPANLDVLRKLFTEPEALRPGITSEKITVEAAERFGELADGMRAEGDRTAAGGPLPR